MSPASLRRVAGASVALALAAVAAATAAAAPTSNEHMTLSSTTIKGVDHGMRVVARGAIGATGTFAGVDGPNAADDLITFRFPKGTLTISGHEQSTKMTPNLRTCIATGVGRGTFTVTAGTGAYAGATGSGTYVRHTSIVGARGGDGACLGRSAPPKLIRYRADVVGDVELG
jgi:hypothetical protein